MELLLWVGAGIGLGCAALVVVLNFLGIGFMMHPREKSVLAALVTLAGLSLSQLSIVIIPVDVYNASTSDPATAESFNYLLLTCYYGNPPPQCQFLSANPDHSLQPFSFW